MRNAGFVLLCLGLLSPLAAAAAPAARGGEVEIISAGKVIPADGSWAIPANMGANAVALFSEQREPFSIHNKSDAPVVIEAIELTRGPGAMEEEFTLQNTALKPGPLDFKKTEVAPKKSFDFYLRYYPVQSGEMTASLTVTYGGGKKASWRVTAKGRDKAVFSERLKLAAHKVFGGPGTDEMITGMAADAKGNVFFSGQVTQVQDKFAYDLFYGKIAPDGTLAWAKLWNGPFRDYARDPGQNDETGGSAGAIDVDEEGFLYLAGATSPDKTNNNFAALVLKIDPATGEPVWEKAWRPEWPERILAKHSAEAYALDAHDGHVYVAGTTGAGEDNSDARAFLLSLSAKDGAVEFQRAIDPTPKSNDRAYCVRADGAGNVYVGGLAANAGLLVKFRDAAGGSPKVAWAKRLELGTGGNVNCLDVDGQGNVYASLDRRGVQTFFSFLKLGPDGGLLWGKTYEGGSNKNNNCSFVKIVGDALYAGGRTGQSVYDAQMGDGQLVKIKAADGSEVWSAFYFCGKGPDELAEHRVKGLAAVGDRLHLLGQVYTGNHNGVRYWGYWYNGVNKLSDYRPTAKDLGLKEDDARDMPKGEARDAKAMRQLHDLAKLLPWQDAPAKKDGKGPDAEMIYWQLDAK